jgi:hypothetical protein
MREKHTIAVLPNQGKSKKYLRQNRRFFGVKSLLSPNGEEIE